MAASEPPAKSTAPAAGPGEFARRVWVAVSIVVGTGAFLLLLRLEVKLFLLLFAGILVAVVLRSLSDPLSRRTGLGRAASLGVVLLLLVGVITGLGFWMAEPISEQINQLTIRLPQALEKLRVVLDQHPWTRRFLDAVDPNNLVPQARGVLREARGLFSITLSVVSGVFLILFLGLYLALNARQYMDGLIRLVPIHRRPRVREVLGEIGATLHRWLLGQLLSMTILGVVSGLGLHLLNVPLAWVLGFLTGALDFIPLIGPFIAGTATVLLAFLVSPVKALYVLIFFITLQFVESHLLIPIIQRRAAQVPPVLTILAMVLFGSMFGFLGVLLATPLLATALILIKRLYVEDVLGDRPDSNPA